MATTFTSPKTVVKTDNLWITKVTITWDNSDLVANDISHGGPKGQRPTLSFQGYNTTAGTNVGTFTLDDSDVTNGEVDITAKAEVGGSVASMVSEHFFLFTAFGDQAGGSITP